MRPFIRSSSLEISSLMSLILLTFLLSYSWIFLDSATNFETSTWRASIFLFVLLSSAWYLSLNALIFSRSSLNALSLAWRSFRLTWELPWASFNWIWRNLSCYWIVKTIFWAPSMSSLKLCILFLNLWSNFSKNPLISLQLDLLLAALTIKTLTSFEDPASIILIT